MKYLLVLLFLPLALLGCGSWKDLTPPGTTKYRLWQYTEIDTRCNMRPTVYVLHVPDKPDSVLYVDDRENIGRCIVSLRPAYVSDTGRLYRWDEIPHSVKVGGN